MGKSMFLRKEVGRREDMEAFEFFFFFENSIDMQF
jgi:hypothetical protein